MNIIYTAIGNNYDELREIRLEPGWRAICFSDTDIKSNSWEIIRIDNGTNRFFREVKTNPHFHLPLHEKSVWVDGNIQPIISLTEFVKDKEGFWLMTHPDRDCVYEEAKRCIELKKDDPKVIEKQIQRYLLDGYPHKNGLSATGVIVRNDSVENCNFGSVWWNEISNGSVRDQLSFNYAARKMGLKFNMFPFLQGFNYFYHPHKIREMEEKERLRAERAKLGGHANRIERKKKLWARKTAAYYKLYGNGQNGDNSKTY